MDFWQAIVSGFKNYVGFSGRACRSEYWYWVLAMIILSIITGIIDYAAFGDSEYGPVNSIFSLATFLPSLAMGFRRLHDIDRTAWWWLIAFTVIGIFLLLYWACVKGTTGPNRFGPDPLGGSGLTHQ
ncbi:MAG: DUF805 domain-containing protein [Xanthobacteraceae bacterium]|nr:DUF805 domain-containing protein [Xanthobacteraceae bacterium]